MYPTRNRLLPLLLLFFISHNTHTANEQEKDMHDVVVVDSHRMTSKLYSFFVEDIRVPPKSEMLHILLEETGNDGFRFAHFLSTQQNGYLVTNPYDIEHLSKESQIIFKTIYGAYLSRYATEKT